MSAASQRARLAAATRWAHEPDRTAATAAARSAFMDRFEREVDPDGKLDPVERAARAASAKRAYYQRLAMQSARVRRGLSAKSLKRTPVPKHVRRVILARDGVICRYCGDIADPLHIDHVIPWSEGGTDDVSNLVVACQPCNGKKSNKALDVCGLTLRPAPRGSA